VRFFSRFAPDAANHRHPFVARIEDNPVYDAIHAAPERWREAAARNRRSIGERFSRWQRGPRALEYLMLLAIVAMTIGFLYSVSIVFVSRSGLVVVLLVAIVGLVAMLELFGDAVKQRQRSARPESLHQMLDSSEVELGIWMTSCTARDYMEVLLHEKSSRNQAGHALVMFGLIFGGFPLLFGMVEFDRLHHYALYLVCLGFSIWVLAPLATRIMHRRAVEGVFHQLYEMCWSLVRHNVPDEARRYWTKQRLLPGLRVLLNLIPGVVLMVSIILIVIGIRRLDGAMETFGSAASMLAQVPTRFFELFGVLGVVGVCLIAYAGLIRAVCRGWYKLDPSEWEELIKRAEVILPAHVGKTLIGDDDCVRRIEGTHGALAECLKPLKKR